MHDYWNRRVERAEMTPGTAARYSRVFASFVRFTAATGCANPADADLQLVIAFVRAPRGGGLQPAGSTSRFRLTVVRDAFAALRDAGLVHEDPSAPLSVVHPAMPRVPVPLTPAEISRLRAAGRVSPRDHVRPAAVELALAGGTHLEIAHTVVGDLDLRGARVRLGDRRSDLEPFAVSTLVARVASCRRSSRRARTGWDPSETALALRRPFETYPETSIAPGISSSLSRAMKNAGVVRNGVRPASLREYAANRRYALTDRVEDVAALLGLDSLDVARGFICERWQCDYGEAVRALAG